MKKIAILGATGNVGRQLLSILYERNFPINKIYCVASKESSGKKINLGNKELIINSLEDLDFSNIDIVFSALSSEIAKDIIPQAVKHGCIVIDKSSYYRLNPDVPLIIPEVNLDQLLMYKKTNIIASPNCCVIPLSMALKPLDNISKIKRVIVSTYQSTSGAGQLAMDELYNQIKSDLNHQIIKFNVFPKKIAFNVIPQIEDILDNGYSAEENKISKEIQKIFNRELPITVTAVRVPTFIGHSAAVNVEFEKFLSLNDAEEALSTAKGVEIIRNHDKKKYITPAEAIGYDQVFISRLRQDSSCNNAMNFWLTNDNLRKGAALNAIQIAEALM